MFNNWMFVKLIYFIYDRLRFLRENPVEKLGFLNDENMRWKSVWSKPMHYRGSLISFHLINPNYFFYKLNQAEKKLLKEKLTRDELNACSIPITTDGELCDLFEVQIEEIWNFKN